MPKREEEWKFREGPLNLGKLDGQDNEYGIIRPELTPVFSKGDRQVLLKLERKETESSDLYPVELDLENGAQTIWYRLTLIQILNNDQSLSTADLRDIPIASMVNMTLARLKASTGMATGLRHSAASDFREMQVPEKVKESWPNGDQDLVFRWVKIIYEGALAYELPPTKTVGEKFGVSYNKAIHLVRRARDLGVLTSSSVNDPRRKKDKASGTNKAHSRATGEHQNPKD